MPELPELEIVQQVLQRRVAGTRIEQVLVLPPGGAIVVRDLTQRGFAQALTGATIASIVRRKFLLFAFDSPLFLVINPKRTGRLQLAAPGEKRLAETHVVCALSSGDELRYVDQKRMGQLYLTRETALVPGFAEMGPEPLELSLDEFRERLRPFRGEIKGVLTRGACVAGIGNAYADEILWNARLHPYCKRPSNH
jgi:formamidopyrimidine-DNA glycosylase